MKKVFIFLFLFFLSFNVSASDYKTIEKKDGIYVLGDYVEYVDLYSEYDEKGAIFYDNNGSDLSSSLSVTYYNHDRQVSKIDTRFLDNYLVKYSVTYNDKDYEASRIVIITDTEGPVFDNFDTVTISDLEAATYKTSDGVKATDNMDKVSIKCFNSLGILPGYYSILCQAKDKNGNVTEKNRLIKVTDNIRFNYSDRLEINFPDGEDYVYKYSLDGKKFIRCDRHTFLDVDEGSVLAAVYLGDELVMSNTFLIS